MKITIINLVILTTIFGLISCIPKANLKTNINCLGDEVLIDGKCIISELNDNTLSNCGNIIHGQTTTRIIYLTTPVTNGTECVPQTQTGTCNDGVINFIGNYQYSNCSPEDADQIYFCQGGIPSNTTACNGDTRNLTQNVDNIIITSCNDNRKCEYLCNSGYTLNNGGCQAREGVRMHTMIDLKGLSIDPTRIPDYSYAGVEGGIPDTSSWNIINVSTYGAVPNDNNDDTAAIQNAINAAEASGVNTVVKLAAGTYIHTQPTIINLKSNIVIKGAGQNSTTIRSTRGTNTSTVFRAYASSYGKDTRPIISGTTRGSNFLTLGPSRDANFTKSLSALPGKFVIVAQKATNSDDDLNNNDPRIMTNDPFNRRIGQIVKVIEVNGDTIKIEPAIRENLLTIADPRVEIINDFYTNIGIEDLTIYITSISSPPGYRGSIKLERVVNSWIKNVKFENSYTHSISLNQSARISIKNNHFKTIQKSSYTNTYSITFGRLTTDCRAENNIQEDVWVTAMFVESANRNVYAYNYHKDIRQDHGIIHHGGYPFENLVEGNEAYRITNDCWWGKQGPRLTFFRNRASEIRTSKNGSCENDGALVADQANFIANSANYFLSFPWCTYPDGCGDFDDFNTNMWSEYNFTRVAFKGINTPLASNTFINNETGTNSISNHNIDLPDSLYLITKPDFWCDELPWPAIGADIDNYGGVLNKLPAQIRYEGGSCTTH